MANIRKTSLWFRATLGAVIASIFSILHLAAPAWATDEKAAIKALNQKVNLLMQELSKDKSFDENLSRSLRDLDTIINSYSSDGDTQMGKFLGDQPANSDIRMGKFLGDQPTTPGSSN